MATPSGTPDFTLVSEDIANRLRDEPYCFDFFQAVRLLERLYPDRGAIGESNPLKNEVVRVGVNPTLAFPASQIQSLTQHEDGPPTMVVNFMGLIGPSGTLPLYYTELVASRVHARDYVMRDFFDIFHHRIVSLFYQAWQKYRFPARPQNTDAGRLSQILLDLIGLGTPGLQKRQPVIDDSLRYYSGLLAQEPHSATAFQLLLSDYFEAPVEIQQFVGGWYRVDTNAQCNLDDGAEKSRQLGRGAMVGDEIWEPQARVRIVLGPLPRAQYLDFLPTGTAYEPLRAITRLYSGDEIDFEVQLILARDETPGCELGAEGDVAPRLGLLSWAKSKPMDRDPADAILRL
jgi:type VI secretion system protein ImpH